MIIVGLTGGMGQGKSTVGEILRKLAEVDYKADLEASYPITEVANAWMATWPKPFLVPRSDQTIYEFANHLIQSLPPVFERITGKTADINKLLINETDPANVELNSRLIKYLDVWVWLSEDERVVQLPTPINPENKGLHRNLFQWIGGIGVSQVSQTIWSDLLDHRIKKLAGRGYKLVTVGGVRYEHDAAMIHANGGNVLRVERPNAHNSTDVTETSMKAIKPDVLMYNDGTLKQLEAAVNDLWRDLQAGKPAAEYRASA